MVDMLLDAAGSSFEWTADEPPNQQAQEFYNIMKAADEPLWDGCDKEHTVLACVTDLLSIKADCGITKEGFNRIISAVKKWLPKENRLPPNQYQCKKLVKGLGLSHVKIHACPNDCMLYYDDDNISKEKCDVCGHNRFKPGNRENTTKRLPYKEVRYLPIGPRLLRLFLTSTTAEQMRWHKEGKREKEGVMVHPADAESWKEFNRLNPDFAADPRNVRLGLCSDGFSPFNMGGRSYSNWPVFLVVYNLPPALVMRDSNIFLSLLIPGPNSPTRSIDIYLQPLVDELNNMWKDGVLEYDKFKKQNFTMRAALMGTISDYPALSMLSGWSTKGKLDAFKKNTIETDGPPRRLSGQELFDRVSLLQQVTFGTKNKKNIPGFGETHNWKKRSIFWELPYWKDHLVRHHIDVMHLEMNFFKNILFTLFDVKGKTKDNAKARLDMAQLCSCPHLELATNDKGNYVKPHATYCLDKKQRREFCEWVKNLKFPDGYASNLSNIVDVDDGSFSGMKSHDCHVFMERLLPTAFRDFLPNPIWEALTEVSNFFRDICAKELDPVHIEKLEKDIIVTMCKLEKIFPPGFFDSMEHLITHIAYEARVCGPVSFRWMYIFERCIGRLKRNVANKARVEGSIVEMR
ncbi:uncharacterized protein LOC144557101 [Carex rostrata]